MGANDAAEMLKAAQAECVRLERALAKATAELAALGEKYQLERSLVDDLARTGERFKAERDTALTDLAATRSQPTVTTGDVAALLASTVNGEIGWAWHPSGEPTQRAFTFAAAILAKFNVTPKELTDDIQ